MTDDAAPSPPTPRTFFIHDDLTETVRQCYGDASEAFRLTQELFRLVRCDPQRVVVLTLEDQLA